LTAATAYQFFVQARDAANNISASSNIIDVTTPDTQAPTAPTNLSSSNLSQTSFTLTWNASTDNVGVTGYDVYQDNVKINSTPITTTSFAVTGLTTDTNYVFFCTGKRCCR
jgi:chitodextrinase